MNFDTIKLKQVNVDRVRHALRQSETCTKNSLAQETGLSVASCGNILSELLERGEVQEVALASSTGGRPSRRFAYNARHALVLVIYLRLEGSMKTIYSAVVDLRGEVLDESFAEVAEIDVDSIVGQAKLWAARYEQVESVSVGVPGVVNEGLIEGCDVESLNGVALASHLNEMLDCPVTVENDVNATALGFYHQRTNLQPESLVYIYFPEDGIAGAGIVVNGRVIRGRNRFAGEVSYMPLSIARHDQAQAQQTIDRFARFASEMVLSTDCLLNPESIVLAGQWLRDEHKDAIQRAVSSSSLPNHVPELHFECDIHASYLAGLTFSGLQQLSCGIQIIKI
ncbi:N-acetylglucosamine repressor [Pontiella sulfatireligans]|uniref:N-acetylglucosamine repressor n=1 Tax=Pontiella sulfatireligans TaxID=2750658 RepID=A0A6C2UST5_9BACT|nr:N-acetylglucosamine repressor [Pontiella sulfatireligans]